MKKPNSFDIYDIWIKINFDVEQLLVTTLRKVTNQLFI